MAKNKRDASLIIPEKRLRPVYKALNKGAKVVRIDWAGRTDYGASNPLVSRVYNATRGNIVTGKTVEVCLAGNKWDLIVTNRNGNKESLDGIIDGAVGHYMQKTESRKTYPQTYQQPSMQ